MLRWPAGLDAERFLRDYWQKRPLFMPRALPGFETPLDPDELAGLACDADVESRLVLEYTRPPWSLERGPFEADRLRALPAGGWSLLVQDIDKHLPALVEIAAAFDFVPAWRFDDLMASHAPPGGSVGPHVDAYDVFLVQGQGTRTWALDPEPADTRRRPGTPLNVLAAFDPKLTHTARPGDVLYLPPGVAHHGVAVDACVTWSVGFRSPSMAELLQALAETPGADEARYSDADLQPIEVADGLIHPRAVERFRRRLQETMLGRDGTLERALGRLLTEPKPWLQPAAPEEKITPAELRTRLAAGGTLGRHGMALFARTEGNGESTLYVDGRSWRLPAASGPMIRDLCAHRSWPAATVLAWIDQSEGAALICSLLNQGSLEII